MWGEAVRHATYLINRVPTRALKNQTPYESFKGRKPSIGHIRVFGCLAYAKLDAALLKKLDNISQTLVHLGIEQGSKAYRLYNPSTRRIVVCRDVKFDEKACWNWNETDKGKQVESGKFHMTWGSSVDEGKSPFVIGSHQEENIETETDQQEETTEPTPREDHVAPRRSSREVKLPKHLEDYILLAEIECELHMCSINDEPSTYQEAKIHV